jgi:hypothetical protein
VLWWQRHSLLQLLRVLAQQRACAAVMIAHVRIADVMQTSARARMEAHASVPQAVLRRVATRAAVKLLLNQVAAKKVNAIQNETESDCMI